MFREFRVYEHGGEKLGFHGLGCREWRYHGHQHSIGNLNILFGYTLS